MKQFLLIFLTFSLFVSAQQEIPCLVLTNDKKVATNYNLSVKGAIIGVTEEQIQFRAQAVFNSTGNSDYDKPKYLDVADDISLRKMTSRLGLSLIDNLKASYHLKQNNKKFIIRSSAFLKLENKKETTFKAILYTIKTHNKQQKLIIIYAIK